MLGLSGAASGGAEPTQKEIAQAYRRAALRWHPDKHRSTRSLRSSSTSSKAGPQRAGAAAVSQQVNGQGSNGVSHTPGKHDAEKKIAGQQGGVDAPGQQHVDPGSRGMAHNDDYASRGGAGPSSSRSAPPHAESSDNTKDEGRDKQVDNDDNDMTMISARLQGCLSESQRRSERSLHRPRHRPCHHDDCKCVNEYVKKIVL